MGLQVARAAVIAGLGLGTLAFGTLVSGGCSTEQVAVDAGATAEESDGDGFGAGAGAGPTAASGSGPGCPAPEWPPSAGSCSPFEGSGGFGGAGGSIEPVYNCNPVTGYDCADGETCDGVYAPASAELLGFRCFDGPNGAAECSECNPIVGPFCENGSQCYSGVCRSFCCASEDCASGATCVMTANGSELFPGAPDLGLCLPSETE